MKKENKIIVVVDPDPQQRRVLIAKIAVRIGFARTTSDAMKIIHTTPFDYDLNTAYLVLAGTYDFRSSPITTQKLFEMASRGLGVVIGVKRLPKEFEYFTRVYYNEDF